MVMEKISPGIASALFVNSYLQSRLYTQDDGHLYYFFPVPTFVTEFFS